MKITIHSSPLSSGHQHRGVGTYTRLLIASLKQYFPEQVYFISPDPYSTKADVVHYPFFDLFFLTLPFSKPISTVVTVHDVIPLLFPQAYPPGIRGTIKFNLQKLSLSSAHSIVTDSQCSTRDAVRHLSLPRKKTSTVYLAADPSFSPASHNLMDEVKQNYRLTDPYFLYVGDINYNKNLPALFTAFTKVSDRAQLVIVSKALKRDNPAAKSLFQLIDSLSIQERIRILTDVPNEPADYLRGLYSGAAWYIQPSLYEGFGLPVLEAQACETPVISSNGGSLAEIIHDSTLSYDPRDTTALTSLLSQALDMTPSERRHFVDMGLTNTHLFDWQKTAKAMMEIYSQCAA